jgi:hypothetical protein
MGGPRYGKVALAGSDSASPQQPPEDVVLRRARLHLEAAADRVSRLARARTAVAELLAGRRAEATARRIADTDYPDRQWMLDRAEYQVDRVLADLSGQEPTSFPWSSAQPRC